MALRPWSANRLTATEWQTIALSNTGLPAELMYWEIKQYLVAVSSLALNHRHAHAMLDALKKLGETGRLVGINPFKV